ncbi:MAG: hypothetical protein IH864_04595 [Chloroflexi bacterium]|nr:hypothetical protein [Chloroflexota bacterium]
MNDLAAALGSGLSVVPALIDTGFNTTTNIDSSSFTVGVSSIRYAATSEVAVSGAAESLVRTKGGTTFIGADSIGSGVFFLLGDFNVLSDQSDSGYIIQDNGALAANMCGGPSTTPTPTSTSTPTSTPTPAVPAATATPAPTATATPTAPTAAPAVLAATATPAPTATAVLGVTQLPSTGGEPAGGSSALAWLALAIGALIVTSGGLALAYQRRRVR